MRPVTQILSELRELEVRIWLDADQLRYRAPSGVLGPERIAELRERKAEIIAHLAGFQAGLSVRIPVRPKESGNAPLSAAQNRLWLLDQVEGPSATYNIPVARRLRGPLDLAALEMALARVHLKHETLRTSIVMVDGLPRQRVSAALALPLTRVDFSHLSLADAEAAVRILVSEEADRPFDLEAAPLWRVLILRLSERDHVLAMTFHHLVADGWSMGVLCRELEAAYASHIDGRPTLVEDLPVQYGDYAHWQAAVDEGRDSARSIAYWRQKLADAPPLLQLFPQRSRPAKQGYRGQTLAFEIEEPVATRLKRLANDSGSSLFMVLLTVFVVLVRRYVPRDDIVLGTPVANRDRPELEPLIGFFTNYLVLRIDVGGDPDFRALLQRVRDVALEAYEHQAISFDKLVEAVGGVRDASYTPLVQIMFMLHVQEMDKLDLPGVAAETFDIPVHTAKCDLTFGLKEHAGKLTGEVIYNVDIFSVKDIERLIAHFVELASGAAASPDRKISRFSMMTGREVALLAQAERGPVTVADGPLRLEEAFVAAARRFPDRIAVRDRDRLLRYGELQAKAASLAGSLRASGVKSGDIVAVCLERSVDLITAILAVLMADAAYLPLDPGHSSSRHARILNDAGVELVVTSARLGGGFQEGPAHIFCLDAPWPPASPCAAAGTGTDLAYVIYTSGSTGVPRGVMIEHRSAMNLLTALDLAIYRDMPDSLQVGLVASVAFDASVQQIFASLAAGHTLHILDAETRGDSDAVLDWLCEGRIEVVDLTPTLLSMLVASGLTERSDMALRHVIVGGEPLKSSLATAFFEGAWCEGRLLSNIYGPTECCVDATLLTLDRAPAGRGTVVPIGRPLANTQAYILDEFRQRVPIGVSGEIWLAGRGVGRGYLGLPELTEQKFTSLPDFGEVRVYRTGDIGAWTEEGTIEFLGRSDGQVKVRGHRIELGEIDAVLASHPLVESAVTIARHSAADIIELVSYVAMGPDAEASADVRRWLASELPDYMRPAHIVVLPELPLNVSGKIDRAALPAVDAGNRISAAAYRAPESPAERLLAEIWEGVLDVRPIGLDDRFLDLGGDSIKALQIVSRLRSAGWRMELRSLFTHPTVGELSPLIARATPHRSAVTEVDKDIPLTPIQLEFFDTFDGDIGYYNQSVLLEANGPLDRKALRAALQALVDFHPMLRARFTKVDGVWSQSISPAAAITCEEVDFQLSPEPDAALLAAIERLHKTCSLPEGGLFRAGLFSTPGGERILLVGHHLIVDGVSWRILLDDLAEAYERSRKGLPITLATSSSFAQWSDLLGPYADQQADQERDFWRAVAGGAGSVVIPALDASAPMSRLGERRSVRVTLSKAETDALVGPANAAYRTEVNDLLLTAFVRGIAAAWLSLDEALEVLLSIEGHGREDLFPDIDLSRTVGWFTTEYPVRFRLSAEGSLGRHIKETKETLRSVPGRGIGYGMLRHRATRRLEVLGEPRIGFNFLGSVDANVSNGPFRWSAEPLPSASDPKASMRLDVEVVGMIRGGILALEIVYAPTRVREREMNRLAEAVKAELRAIVAHTATTTDSGPTPSDIDYTGFEIDQLDEFLNNLQ